MSSRLRFLSGSRLIGRAFTVQLVAGDSATSHRALEHAPSGHVLVIDGGGYTDRAVWGEVLTVAAEARGIRGLVLDGAVRDIVGLRERGFPVVAAATSPAGPHKSGGGDWAETISCGGVTVNNGDLIVADADGVVVVPWHRRQEIARTAAARVADEQTLLEQLAAGVTSSAAYLGLS
jgi:regulator of RNase E activity RraA